MKTKKPATEIALDAIIQKALEGQLLSGEEVEAVLQLEEPQLIEHLFNTALQVRQQYFGDQVFLYGFLYTSTYCRNHCRFCFYRIDNPLPSRYRYRKTTEQILASAQRLAESGVHLIDLTLGEDPQNFNSDGPQFEPFIDLVKRVRAAVDLPIMVSPGVMPGVVLEQLSQAGAQWYACYQETHNPTLFRQLRPNQDYDIRLNTKLQARNCGMLTEEGILVGVGETAQDIAHSFKVMRSMGLSQVRAMNFVPQAGTPMSHLTPPHPFRELKIIALLRLMFPHCLIPATLDVEGLSGLKQRLKAGANVVTSIVPPGLGLAGVAQNSLDIEDARRTTEHVRQIINQCGLQEASLGQYLGYIQKENS